MDAEEIDAAAAAAELNILGGLASVTGLQSPAPTRPAGATANGARNGKPVFTEAEVYTGHIVAATL